MSSKRMTLTEIRQDKGRSAADLADHLLIDAQYIKRLEHGYYLTHRIDPEKVKVFYRFYGPAVYRYIQQGL